MSGIVKNYKSLIGGFESETVTTFNPSLDGHVGRENTNESWSTKLAGAGNVSTHTGTALAIRMSSSSDASNPWRTFRTAMVLFDTSAIGSGTIISATFQVALNNKTDYFSDSMSLVNATPESNSSLADADWQDFGTTKQASDKTIASFSTDGSYNTMELNATGLAAINKTGITKYGFTFTSLIDDDEHTWASDQVGVLSVQSRGGTNPPQLVVTYTSSGNADTHTKGSGADVQIFTTTGSSRTWVKPSWATTVYIEVIGAGGGGGSGARESGGTPNGGGGGGGGVITRTIVSAESLASLATITVGAGGAGGANRSDQGSGANGTAGGFSSFDDGAGLVLKAFGGGYGAAGSTGSTQGGGGGGGGTGAVGSNGSGSSGGDGGSPTIQGSTTGDSLGGRGGAGGDETGNGGIGNAEFGGAGGGGGYQSYSAGTSDGASSIFGAGGGGGAGGINAQGSDGGAWGSYTEGGGGSRGTSQGASGGAGTSRGYGCGDGGGSGGGASSSASGVGGAGGVPGGGGAGGAGCNVSTTGAGGVGGKGTVRVYSW